MTLGVMCRGHPDLGFANDDANDGAAGDHGSGDGCASGGATTAPTATTTDAGYACGEGCGGTHGNGDGCGGTAATAGTAATDILDVGDANGGCEEEPGPPAHQ